jgi:hypothetical protein
MKPRKLIFQALQVLQNQGGSNAGVAVASGVGAGAGSAVGAQASAAAAVPPSAPDRAAGPPPGTPDNFVQLWTFLAELHLSQYYQALRDAHVDLNSLPLFDEADFADLGIPKGPTVSIRHATARLRERTPTAKPSAPGSSNSARGPGSVRGPGGPPHAPGAGSDGGAGPGPRAGAQGRGGGGDWGGSAPAGAGGGGFNSRVDGWTGPANTAGGT